MLKGLIHTGLVTKDLESSISFFKKAFLLAIFKSSKTISEHISSAVICLARQVGNHGLQQAHCSKHAKHRETVSLQGSRKPRVPLRLLRKNPIG